MGKNSVSLVCVACVLAASFAACSDSPVTGTDASADAGMEMTVDVTTASLAECAPFPATLTKWDSLPGIALHITDVSGGTGPSGNLAVGDKVSVTFTVTSHAGGCYVRLDQLNSVGIWLAGPTSNYQRVLPINTTQNRANVQYDASTAVANADGSYTFTFPDPIPATYSAPLWDTPKFSDGELSGQPLLDGTYTIAMRAFRTYALGEQDVVDPSTDVKDVLFGAATTIESREVVTTANCNGCHTTLQRHSGVVRDTRVCVTCHTAGAEDGNSTATGDATPITTEFGVMIHKIHDGKHLPSVLGIATNADGTRKYDATPVPYVVGSGLRDFSTVAFPLSPNFRIPMPRHMGYSTLTSTQQALDDTMRMGATGCDKCHGDPDGAGPLPAPAQGDRAYSNMKRRTCGSCHDDIDWTQPYVANGQTQPPQPDDSTCTTCHKTSGDSMAAKDSHVHPLEDPAQNPGLVFTIQSVAEGGNNNGNGKLDPGEKILVSFSIKDGSNADVPASTLSSLSIAVSGPTTNRNLLLANTSVPLAALPAGPLYTTTLPQQVSLDFAGTATNDGAVESFTTSLAPHWNVTGALTTVYERTATSGGSSTTLAPAAAPQNFVDVGNTAGFARSDYVVIDDGNGAKELQQINFAEGSRLWLSPGLRKGHAAGAAVQEVVLTKNTNVVVTASTGTITEASAASIAAGHDVVVSYTTDFVVPSAYPAPANDSPDLDETWGEWAGKGLVSGTYTLGIWGSRSVVANSSWGNDATSYKAASAPSTKDFLVGSATTLVPYALISSGTMCNGCHNDLVYHGGQRRGFETCILCHGNAGAEDRPRYLAANAPATTGVTVNFRGLAHASHMGASLPQASSYTVVGYGPGAYPNNFSTDMFGGIVFPVKPDGVGQCTKCHGTLNTAWKAPSTRDHPTQQGSPVRTWRAACGSCHDSASTTAHIEAQTYQGSESCAVCHGPGTDYDVAISHKSW